MNKYQSALIGEINPVKGARFSCRSQKTGDEFIEKSMDLETDVFTLVQEKDIFSTRYPFKVSADANIIEDCQFFLNGKWQNANKENGCYVVVLDFENRAEKIKIIFTDNIVDDWIIDVRYVEADKELYYAEERKKKQLALCKVADVRCATGVDLVNIYFQPCCDAYARTEIFLYTLKGKYRQYNNGITYEWRMITKCKVEEDDFYKSITGLAVETYSFVLKQYDKNNDLLFETEHIRFDIPNMCFKH